MVKDEICQTYLPEEEALQEKSEGKIYYFCSETCRRRFLETKKKAKS
ncbi:MAG: YHS domain-containing protein [Candidatus Aminicenantales bacterium]